MKGKSPDHRQLDMFNARLSDQLDPKHPLYRLGNAISRDDLDHEFSEFYSTVGRNAHPTRLMAGLLILKQLRNLSDESVVERWVENGYYQYFCGEKFV